MRQLNQILFVVALFLAVACNIPEQKQGSDVNFNALLSEAKRQVEFYPDSALMILRELLPGQQGEEKAVNRGKVLNLTGVAYDVKGIYDSAAYYLYEASQLAEKIQDDSLQMSVYTNLGILQFEMNNADETIKYYQQSLAIAEQLKDSTVIANQLNNIGNTYLTITHELEKAIPYFERCMEITEQTGYSRGTLVAGINLAQIYNELGELDKAMEEIKRLAGIDGNYIYTDFTLGEILLKKGRYGESLHTFKNLLNKQLNTREFELAILKNIAEVYKVSGNLDSTVVYLEKSYALRDSLHNRQTDETIHNLKIAYETEKKEMQITTLEEEKQLMIWLSVAGSAVLLMALAASLFLAQLLQSAKALKLV